MRLGALAALSFSSAANATAVVVVMFVLGGELSVQTRHGEEGREGVHG